MNIKTWGVNQLFHNLILTYRVLSKLQDAFYKFKKFKITFEIEQVKVREDNRFLMGGANKNCEYL